MGQYLLVLISIEEANGFPRLSLKALKELNDTWVTKEGKIAPFIPLPGNSSHTQDHRLGMPVALILSDY